MHIQFSIVIVRKIKKVFPKRIILNSLFSQLSKIEKLKLKIAL